jgi:hypothetical protein
MVKEGREKRGWPMKTFFFSSEIMQEIIVSNEMVKEKISTHLLCPDARLRLEQFARGGVRGQFVVGKHLAAVGLREEGHEAAHGPGHDHVGHGVGGGEGEDPAAVPEAHERGGDPEEQGPEPPAHLHERRRADEEEAHEDVVLRVFGAEACEEVGDGEGHDGGQEELLLLRGVAPAGAGPAVDQREDQVQEAHVQGLRGEVARERDGLVEALDGGPLFV